MKKMGIKSISSLMMLVAIFLLLSACSTPAAPQAITPPVAKSTVPNTAIPSTETLTPSPTPDTRSRLLTNDHGDVLRPETEINNKNFQEVELLGTLGLGIPVVIQFSPDDKLLVVGTSLGVVNIYDSRTSELLKTIQTNSLFQFPTYFNDYTMCNPCGRIAISPDNKLLGVLSVDGKIQIWNLDNQQKIASSTEVYIAWVTQQRLAGEGIRTGGSVLRFSDDSNYLGVFPETIWWPPGTCLYAREEQCNRNFERPYFILSASGSALSITPWCGLTICETLSSVQIQDDLSQFYDLFTFNHENLKLPPIPLPKTMNEKTHAAGKGYLNPKQQYISADGRRALSYDIYGVANKFPRYGNSEVIYAGTLWDVPNNKVINTFGFPYVDIYAFSHDLNSIAYMSSMGIAILDIQSGTNREEISFSTCLGKLAFSPDGSTLAGYYRSTIYFCDPLTGNVTHVIPIPTGFISSIAFSPDGKFIASTGQTWGNYLSTSKKNYDPYVYIWNVSDGRLVTTLEHEGDTMIVKFSPDGKYIATGAGIDGACAGVASPHDERFLLWSWDGQNATKIKEQKFDSGIANIAFSSDSQQILLATNEAYACTRKQPRIYLYDIADNVLSKTYYEMKRTDPPVLLEFFPKENMFLVGAGWEATRVSILTNSADPTFSSTDYYMSYPHQEYIGIYPSPNWSVVVSPFYDNNSVEIGDIASPAKINMSGDFVYTSLAFSSDGRVIYGSANIMGVITVWGIPLNK